MSPTTFPSSDRWLRRIRPKPDSRYTPDPLALDEGLWVLDRRLRAPGLTLPNRSTLVRLPSGGLWLHSPPPMDADTRRQIESLGNLEAVVAPNSFHYLFAAGVVEAFPSATLFVCPSLPERVPDLPPHRVLADEAPSAWQPDIELAQVVSPPYGETVFLHRPSRTLVLTDLVFKLDRLAGWLNKLVWRLQGAPLQFGVSRTARQMLLRPSPDLTRTLTRISDWSFERILVAHGSALERNARESLRGVLAPWLAE